MTAIATNLPGGGRTGITNHNHMHNKEAEKTMDGRIRGSGGDESPLGSGEEKRASRREPFIHSSLKNTELLTKAFLVGLTGNKWSLSGRGAILVPFKNPNPLTWQKGLLKKKKKVTQLKKVCYSDFYGLEVWTPLLPGREYQPAPWWPLDGGDVTRLRLCKDSWCSGIRVRDK